MLKYILAGLVLFLTFNLNPYKVKTDRAKIYLINGAIWSLFIWIWLGPLIGNTASPFHAFLSRLNIEIPTPPSYKNFCRRFEFSDLCQTVIEGRSHLKTPTKDVLNSGNLIHLVALSGGQIGPVVIFTNFMMIAFIASLLFRKIGTPLWNKIILNLIKFNALFIALGFWWVFGRTGTLALAVSSLVVYYEKRFLYFLKKLTYLFHLAPHYGPRLCVLMVATLFQGSIFHDLSFLLSCLGGAVFSCTGVFIRCLPKSNKFLKYWKHTAFTSIFMSFILMPFQSSNPLICALANCLLGPFIQYILIPLALIIYFLFSEHNLPYVLVIAFEWALNWTMGLSYTVIPEIHTLNPKSLSIFSPAAREYLRFCIALVWFLNDCLKYYLVFKRKSESFGNNYHEHF